MDTKTLCERKRTSVREALRRIRRGGRIFLGSGCAEPTLLSKGLTENAHLFADNPVIHILTMGEAAYTQREYSDNFRLNTLFIGPNVRAAVQEGRADYTPVFLSEVPDLFSSGQIPLEAALISVSPPDEDGFCTLGISVDVVKAATQNARIVIAEVNPNMPRTSGDTKIHLDDIDALVENDAPLLEWQARDVADVAEKIAKHVARLVPDGATLQLGIGSVPDAILRQLHGKKDLGIHTEMLSDGVLELVKRGVITGAKKNLHPGKIVTSFALGTRDLYNWVHGNPDVLFFASDYTNDPGVVRQNENMIAINGAISVDLTGQVCADSIGNLFYSGIGGQVDFLRGAAKSKGGKPIIAMPSTFVDENGQCVSRIVVQLEEGAGVVTSRGDVHYVVTEYGIAYLHGKTIQERVRALIEIAHPDFRDELLDAAKQRRYIPLDLAPLPKEEAYVAHLEHTKVFTRPGIGEMEVFFRPIRPADERRLQDFFYSHSDETVYERYGYRPISMTHKRALDLVQLDGHNRLALVGLVGSPGEEKIVAVGRYELEEDTNIAEMAFVVHEEWRGVGMASHLLKYLADVAREKDFAGVCAQIVSSNKAMLHVFNKVLGTAHEVKSWCGETCMTFYFAEHLNDARDVHHSNRPVVTSDSLGEFGG